MMSGFLILVISGVMVIFFSSLLYFVCKRLRKCGDYEMDEDGKSTIKHIENNGSVYSAESQRSMFTLQNSNDPKKGSDDVEDSTKVSDLEQDVTGPNQNKTQILHRSISASTPTITATLVSEQDHFPQSILSSSRRNSTTSSLPRRGDVNSLASGDVPDDGTLGRRKSVTFSDIIQMHHVEQIAHEVSAKKSKK